MYVLHIHTRIHYTDDGCCEHVCLREEETDNVIIVCQRGELASDRARDADIKSLILEATSQQCRRDDVGDMTTESRLETMRSEISSAAVKHRNLVDQLTSPPAPSDPAHSCDRHDVNDRSDRHSDSDSDSSETRSVSSSAAD